MTTHDALGYYARRYGLRVVGTVIPSLSTQAQASAGDLAELVDTIRRERVRAIFAESSVNASVEDAIAQETGARVGRPLWADSLGPAGLERRDLRGLDPRQHVRDRRGPVGRREDVLVPALILDAPYVQRAIAELALLAVLAGVLGSWIVLRRLAFYTHAVGTATFPGLVVAAPWGVAPQLTALAAALGFGAGIERLSRGRRMDPGAATGLLLVAALALGSVLASDVYESGAGVDQLLFGTLIGLSERDVWLTAAAVVAALAAHGAMHRAWLAAGLRPGQRARARRAHGAAPTACCWPPSPSRSSSRSTPSARCSWPSCSSSPPRRSGSLAGDVRTLQLGTAALAAAEGLAALLIADSLDIGPGPGDGGARRRRVRRRWRWCADEPRARRRARRRLRARPRRHRGRLVRARGGPDGRDPGPQRRRQDDAVPRPARRAAAAPRDGRAGRAARPTCRRPTTRGWTSRSTRSTSR